MIPNPFGRVLGRQKPTSRITAGADQAILQRYLSEAQAHPKDPQAHYNLGMVYYVQGRREEALAQFEQAVSLAPDHADSRYYLGMLLAARGVKEKAVQELEWVSENSSNVMLRRMAHRKAQQIRGGG